MTAVKYSHGRAARFYVPLLLQAFAQSFTYPLVGSIVSACDAGVNALSAFSIGQVVMFMIGAIGGGLVMTGMVFAKTENGYRTFRRLNAMMMVALLSIQVMLCMHPIDLLLFKTLLNLPADQIEIARRTLFQGIVMQAGFFLRNVPLVVLFNAYASFEANLATVARISLTLIFALVFPHFGMTGPDWGMFAITVPILIEHALSAWYARKYVPRLEAGGTSSLGEQFRFTMPLSIGAGLLALSPFLMAMFVGRTANAADMLAIHYVTLGIANPVAYAALRMQAVAIQFPPEWDGDRRLLKFSVVSGLLLGALPLALALPGIGDWYYGQCQNVPQRILPTARLVSLMYVFICAIQAVRGRVEGLAALFKRPEAVMAGQIAYTAALVSVLWILLPLGVPGYLMAVSAIYIAPSMSICTIYAVLHLRRKKPTDNSAS
jgi:hypothetical protein